MKKTIDNIKNSTYDGYNLEEVKKKYNTIISNRSNIDKYNNWRSHIGPNHTIWGKYFFRYDRCIKYCKNNQKCN